MGWWSDRFGRGRRAAQDGAELLTTRHLFRTTSERVPLTERDTVRRWLRDLDPHVRQQVHIRRHWGVIAAVSERRRPTGVVLVDAECRSWAAYVPGGSDRDDLTPEQVEHVMLEALTSPERPSWPDWRRLD
jgi:hypothetical protein